MDGGRKRSGAGATTSWAALVAAVALPLVLPADAGAQRPRVERMILHPAPAVTLGPRLSHDFSVSRWALGLQARVPLVLFIEAAPSADLFQRDGGIRDWQLNADALYRLGPLRFVYAGAGLGVLRSTFDGDEPERRTGFNLFAGLEAGRVAFTPVRPNLEARVSFVAGETRFRLAGGLNIVLMRVPMLR